MEYIPRSAVFIPFFLLL